MWTRQDAHDYIDRLAGRKRPSGAQLPVAARLSYRMYLPYGIDAAQAKAWIDQFDEEDLGTALELLHCLTVYSADAVRQMCQMAVQLLRKKIGDESEVLVVPVGPASKSGHMLAYFFRTATDLKSSQFMSGPQDSRLESARVIAYLDDYVGTGDQFLRWRDSFRRDLKGRSVRELYVSLVGVDRGLERIRETAGIDTVCTDIRGERSDCSSVPDDFLEKYSAGLYQVRGQDMWDGYGHARATVAFFYNVPNNTVPIVWSDGCNSRGQEWEPLLTRYEGGGQLRGAEVSNHLIDAMNRASFMSRDSAIEESLAAAETLIDELSNGSDAYAIETTEAAIAAVSEVMVKLVGGVGGMRVNGKSLQYRVLVIRARLIEHLGSMCELNSRAGLEALIRCFELEQWTDKYDERIDKFIAEAISKAVGRLDEGGKDAAIGRLLGLLEDTHYLGWGAYLALLGIAEKGHLRNTAVLVSADDAPTAGYFRRQIRERMGVGTAEEVTAWVNDGRADKIHVVRNYYGKYCAFSIAQWRTMF